MADDTPRVSTGKAIPRRLWLVIACYGTIYFVWGSTYYFIKLSVASIPPLWVVGLRFFCGGLLLLAFCRTTGRLSRFPTEEEWRTIVFLGFFLLLGGNLLVTVAERRVDSYLAALIFSCTPIFIALFNRVLFSIRLPLTAILGIVTGTGGVALLLYDGKSTGFSFSPPVIMLLLALFLWSFATCVSHRLAHYPDVFADCSLQMSVAGAVSCLVAGMIGPGGWVHAVRMPSLLGLTYLAMIGSLAFAAYSYLLLVEPPQRISTYALVNPLIATYLGVVIGQERPVSGLWASLCAIIIGVALLMYGRVIKDFFTKEVGN